MQRPDLSREQSYYPVVFETAGEAIFVCAADGSTIDCNQAALDLLQCTPAQLLGRPPFDGAPDYQPCGRPSQECVADILAVARRGKRLRFEWTHQLADGRSLTIDATARGAHIGDTEIIVIVGRDISRIKALEREQRLTEEKFARAFKAAPDPIIVSEIETGFIREINPAFTEVLGYSEAEAIGRTTLELGLWVDEAQRKQAVTLMREHGMLHNYEVDFRTRDQRILTLLGSSARIDIDGRPFWLVQFRDITEIKRLRLELEKQARTDFLTGLWTRRHLLELANAELARARRYGNPLALLMLDLDHFKRFNDTRGHLAGDDALRQAAATFREVLREVDIPGRYGGEEFAFFLPETNAARALEVAERVRSALEQRGIGCEPTANASSNSPANAPLTVSIGVTDLRPDDVSIDVMLNRADLALYQAKHQGRNRVCLAPADTPRPAELATH